MSPPSPGGSDDSNVLLCEGTLDLSWEPLEPLSACERASVPVPIPSLFTKPTLAQMHLLANYTQQAHNQLIWQCLSSSTTKGIANGL